MRLGCLSSFKAVVSFLDRIYNDQIEGIPRLLWYGAEGDYNILAMELLGLNLEELM